jgi:hypothetical protein
VRFEHISLAIAALLAVVAVPWAGGSRAALPGIPSIYVTYNPDCTFAMTVDGGTTITSTSPPGPTLPPGVYQIQVSMPNPASGYRCGAPRFTLAGPGVDSVTTFPYESILDDHVLPALQPSSTYAAEDETAPAATRVYFSTAATGSSTALLAPAPSTTTTSKGMTEPDIVGSAVVPYRGRLSAAVSAAGRATLTLRTRSVRSLNAGRYDITVADRSPVAGFFVARAGGKPVALTSDAFVGKKTRRVTLTAGRWTFFARAGRTSSFVVAGRGT